jgi:hypothetical protein
MTPTVPPVLVCALGAAVLLAAACAGGKGPGTPANAAPTRRATPGAVVDPHAVQAVVRAPPATAAVTRESVIGRGRAAMRTANGPGDLDNGWSADVDIDGDGRLERATFLWDDEDKVLFAWFEGLARCRSGGSAAVAILLAVHGAGSARGMAEGSGFYAVWLDAGECGAEAAGLYGCRFDAAGQVTGCGPAVIDEPVDGIIIAPPPR